MSTLQDGQDKNHTLLCVRAGFTALGTSLHAWCKANGIAPQNAHKALTGDWTGPKASALIKRMKDASGAFSK